MFRDAQAFNQPIANWKLSAVTDISQMFLGAQAFNQDLNGWEVRSVDELFPHVRRRLLLRGRHHRLELGGHGGRD